MKFMKFMKSVQLTRRRQGRCCSAAFNITADAHGPCKRAEREARNRMEKINIELGGHPLELTLRYKNVPR